MVTEIGRWLIGLGIILVIVGVVLLVLGRLPWFGRLPGDIVIERENLKVFIPLGTMLLISLILTLLANVIARLWR
jgi:ABC-type enterochelin transport system permease subunit